MKYGELSEDVTNKTVSRRIELEKIKKESYAKWNNARNELKELQEECKHENAIIKHGWQGGGIYYCYCTCPDCGRQGSRYIPQYHMNMNNDWYKNSPENQITLEKAIELGKKIGDSFIDNSYWWGEVENYDKLIKDTSEEWI